MGWSTLLLWGFSRHAFGPRPAGSRKACNTFAGQAKGQVIGLRRLLIDLAKRIQPRRWLGRCVLWYVRWFCDFLVGTNVVRIWKLSNMTAQDGCPVLKDVHVALKYAVYGSEDRRETMCAVWPTAQKRGCPPSAVRPSNTDTASTIATPSAVSTPTRTPSTCPCPEPCPVVCRCPPAVVYLHGGGYLAANAPVLMHSVTFLSRSAHPMSVYLLNYPLAPEHPFPHALVSVLRGLRMLRAQGVSKVHLMGDSAGGGLAALCAAVISSRQLLQTVDTLWQRMDGSGGPLLRWEFPDVVSLVVLYGFALDRVAWRSPLPTLGALENKVSHACLQRAFDIYRGNYQGKNREGVLPRAPLTLADAIPFLSQFPPSLFLCGNKDVLWSSNRLVCQMLQQRGFDASFVSYQARHAFFGWPVGWTRGSWKQTSLPASRTIDLFLSGINAAE